MYGRMRDLDFEDELVVPLSELVGKTIVKLELDDERSELVFYCSDGTIYAFVHWQNCCEEVYLEDVSGELSWLLGTPILMADEAQGESAIDEEAYDYLYKWTFYRFATRKGYVNLRFLGISNGYYSVEMNFIKIPENCRTEDGNFIWNEDEEGQDE